jgi:hypothetical protein
MSISAVIQYSTTINNIQTCSLVIDGITYQVQYENGDYIVKSSGQASGNDTSVSTPVTVISTPVSASDSAESTMKQAPVPVSDSAKSTMKQAPVPVSDSAGSNPELNAANANKKKRINTKKLNELLRNK